MKKSIFLIIFFALAITGFFDSCTRADIEELTEGVVLTVNTDIFHPVAAFSFVDANADNPEILSNIKIKIIGEDADKLYSLSGSQNFQVVDGILNLGIDKETAVSEGDPLVFDIVAEANGYAKSLRHYVFYEVDEVIFEQYELINLNNPPKGISVKDFSFNAGADGTSQEITFETDLAGGKMEAAKVTMEEGTILYDADGNVLTGNVKVQLVHFDNREESSLDAFPGGFTPDNVVDEQGNPIEEIEFITAGFVSLDMTVGNKEVTDFSQPIEVLVDINPETINPDTDAPVEAGETIPVWSLDIDEGSWKGEGTAEVFEENGQLKATMVVNHLSWWNLDYYRNICRFGVRATINSPIPKGRTCMRFYTRLINARNGRRIAHRYKALYNGEVIRFYRVPRGVRAYLEVWKDYTSYRNGEPSLATSNSFNLCARTATVNLSQLNYQPFMIDVNVSGICVQAGADVEIKPSAALYYKESGQHYYRYLGYVNRGRFRSCRLEKGKTYDFKARYGNVTYEYAGVPIETTTIDFNGQTLTVTVTETGVSINFQQVEIPADLCEKYF